MIIAAFFVISTILFGCGSSSGQSQFTTPEPAIRLDPALAGLEQKLNQDPQLLAVCNDLAARIISKIESANRISEVFDYIEKESNELAAQFPAASKEIIDSIPVIQRRAAERFDIFSKPAFQPLILRMKSSRALENDLRVVFESYEHLRLKDIKLLAADIDKIGKELIKKYPTFSVELQLAIDAYEAYLSDLLRLI
jgi:hypothetical protein